MTGRSASPRSAGTTAIPVCLNPAYASYLPAVATALKPVLNEIAGLPGAPVRISQAAATYQQGAGNAVGIGLAGPSVTGTPLVYHLLLPDQLLGSLTTTSELASAARSTAGREILASVIGDGPSASQAQHAVMAALIMAVRLPDTPPGTPPTASSQSGPSRRALCEHAAECAASRASRAAGVINQPPEVAPGSPAYAAARRFAALPAWPGTPGSCGT